MDGNSPHADISVADTCRSTLKSVSALRDLANSELELAAAAMLRAVLFACLATACLASAAVMSMILGAALLVWSGLPWPAALAVSTLAAIIAGTLLATRARKLLAHCQMRATRRQLAELAASRPADPPT